MTDSKTLITLSVTEDETDMRLDRFLKKKQPAFNQGLIEKALRKGLIRMNGAKVKASDRTLLDSKITYYADILTPGADGAASRRLPSSRSTNARTTRDERENSPQLNLLLNSIIYEDEFLLAINKPYGIPVQGGSKVSFSIDDALVHLCLDYPDKPRLVHRLDKDTSGVLLLARTRKAAQALAEMFAKSDGRRIRKHYLALVAGIPAPRSARIDLPLAKAMFGEGAKFRARELVMSDAEMGKPAVTNYQVLDSIGKMASLVQLEPVTGRTHQLRVHMASIGCPIVGDGKYGGKNSVIEFEGIANKLHLHAESIEIENLFGKRIEIKAPLKVAKEGEKGGHFAESLKSLGF
jgi:23S rRNA pseudouridine955/2504/2580 synthase